MQIVLDKNTCDDLDISQNVVGLRKSEEESQEYKEIALVSQNLITKKSSKNEEVVKLANYYIKKSSLNNLKNNNLINNINQSERDGMFKPVPFEKHDMLVKGDPQYVVDFVKEIFTDLRKSEVFKISV